MTRRRRNPGRNRAPTNSLVSREGRRTMIDGRKLAMLALLLAGCETMQAGPPPELIGPVWIAEAVGGAALPNQPPVTLQFDGDGRAAGKAACNQYNGPYDLGAASTDNSMTANVTDVAGPISFGAMVST